MNFRLPRPRPPRAPLTDACLALGLALAFLAPAAPARATDAAGAPLPPRAWSLGADIVFSTVEPARVPDGFGLDQTARGLGLRAARALDERWRLQADVSVSDHATSQPDDTVRLTRATLEAECRFRAGRPLRPWVLAGGGWFHAGSRAGAAPCDADGPGLVLGAGWQLRLHGPLHLRGSLRTEAVRWRGGPLEPAPMFDRWRFSSEVVAGITIDM